MNFDITIRVLQKLCMKNFLEYTIDGGSKHPNICIHIWSTYNTKFHVYGIGATLGLALKSVIKQLQRSVII